MISRLPGERAESRESSATTPSRERVEALARARLRQTSYRALHRISCEFRDGVLVLSGRVPSLYIKQLAQDLLISIGGVRAVRNELVVAVLPGTWLRAVHAAWSGMTSQSTSQGSVRC